MIKKTITSTIGRFFKSESQIIFFSKLHKLIIKITNGKIGTNLLGVPILILTTTSSKTGKQYSNPLAYIKYKNGINNSYNYIVFNGFYSIRVYYN